MSRKIEQAAIEWVLAYEREHGRQPVDKRYERAFAGDIESPPRIIEVKATSTSSSTVGGRPHQAHDCAVARRMRRAC